MRSALVVPVALLLALAVPITVEPAGASDPAPDHSFDCGPDVPPSGTYLDLLLGLPMYYDCATHLLLPTGDGSKACDWDSGEDRYVPLYGLCIGSSNVLDESGARVTDTYGLDLLISVVGSIQGYQWWTSYTADGEWVTDLSCGSGPCHPEPGCVSDRFVTYCREQLTRTVDCPATEIWMDGILMVTTQTSALSVGDGRAAELCG